jgi:hypothetical protein
VDEIFGIVRRNADACTWYKGKIHPSKSAGALVSTANSRALIIITDVRDDRRSNRSRRGIPHEQML